jgi:hypothetical protein
MQLQFIQQLYGERNDPLTAIQQATWSIGLLAYIKPDSPLPAIMYEARFRVHRLIAITHIAQEPEIIAQTKQDFAWLENNAQELRLLEVYDPLVFEIISTHILNTIVMRIAGQEQEIIEAYWRIFINRNLVHTSIRVAAIRDLVKIYAQIGDEQAFQEAVEAALHFARTADISDADRADIYGAIAGALAIMGDIPSSVDYMRQALGYQHRHRLQGVEIIRLLYNKGLICAYANGLFFNFEDTFDQLVQHNGVQYARHTNALLGHLQKQPIVYQELRTFIGKLRDLIRRGK